MNLNQITHAATELCSVDDLKGLAERFGGENVRGADARWAFRGQPEEHKSLVPSFWREFRGKPKVLSKSSVIEIEQQLMQEFRARYRKLPRIKEMPAKERLGEGFDLRCLSVMQHYDVPTRLLDWTSNLWVAVYFACASEKEKDAELWFYDRRLFRKQREDDATLASLMDSGTHPPREPPVLDRSGKLLLVEVDPGLTPRMNQQRGHHTVSPDVTADHAYLLTQQIGATKIDFEPDALGLFGRFVVGKACKNKVLTYLASRDQKINASTIFPDLVGLGRYLRWELDSRRTMME
jgi:hypothetical protein